MTFETAFLVFLAAVVLLILTLCLRWKHKAPRVIFAVLFALIALASAGYLLLTILLIGGVQ